MDELITWLLAQIDLDEQVARQAGEEGSPDWYFTTAACWTPTAIEHQARP